MESASFVFRRNSDSFLAGFFPDLRGDRPWGHD